MGEVGLMVFPEKKRRQAFKIDLGHTNRVLDYAEDRGADGPDLGFLALPEYKATQLAAICSFVDLDKRRAELGNPTKSNTVLDAVCGMVGEWTADSPSSPPGYRNKDFTLLFGPGYTLGKRQVGDYDLALSRPELAPVVDAPKSFGGVSGGGLWRFFVSDDRREVLESRFAGIAFYEVQGTSKSPDIICHGPRSIYSYLHDQVLQRWPARG